MSRSRDPQTGEEVTGDDDDARMASASRPASKAEKAQAERQKSKLGSLVGSWQNLSLFWRKIICIAAFLFMAVIATLIITLVIFLRPRAHARDQSNRPSPISSDGQTDNTTASTFSQYPIKLGLLTNFPDPSLYYDSSVRTWYAFGTNQAAGILNLDRSSRDLSLLRVGNLQLAKSTDFVTWDLVNVSAEPLPKPGKWTKQGSTDISSLPYHGDGARNGSESRNEIRIQVPKANVWAPELLRRPSDGKWILYYAAALNQSGSFHCIGTATASRPEGPYTPGEEPIICPQHKGGAIDPAVFVDETDSDALYLAYKVDGSTIGHGGECGNEKDPIEPTPIMLQRLTTDGLSVDHDAEAVQLLDRTEEDGPLVEAPQIVKAGDYYFLFYSSGCTRRPDYDLRYATSSHLTGPYERHEPAFLTTPEFRLTAPGSASVRFASSIGGHGIGTTGPSRDDLTGGQWKLALHGRVNTTIGGVRALFTAGLDFDGRTVRMIDGSASVTK